MSEKKLPRVGLEKLVETCRAYYQAGYDADNADKLLSDWHEAGNAMKEKAGLGRFVLADLVCAVVRSWGLKPEATAEDLVKVLEVLGWQVTDNEQAEH